MQTNEDAPENTALDYAKASRDLERYLPLKLATLLWLLAVFGAAFYGVAATWNEWWPYPQLDVRDLDGAKPALYSFFSGMLGACVFALRGLYWAAGPQHPTIRRFQYDPNFTLWYVARPFMGAVLGVFTFAFLRAGVGTLGTASTDGGASAAYFAIAFLAGFSVTEVMTWFYRTAKRIFGTTEAPDTNSNKED